MSSSSDVSISDTDTHSFPIGWVFIPIIVIAAIVVFFIFHVLRRRRRRRNQGDVESRAGVNNRQVVTLTTPRPQEGLNELGQAPPPYERKLSTDTDEGTELGELQPGERLPDYPAEPPPAVIRPELTPASDVRGT